MDLSLSQKIKEYALNCGADLAGIAPAIVSDAAVKQLKKFVEERRHGGMHYLEDYEKRVHPENVLAGAKSVIVAALNYYHASPETLPGYGRVARYAYGRDYHKVLKGILKKIAAEIKRLRPDAACRVCVDSAPLLEKYYAVKAGIGFIGNNTTLITKKFGSFVVLGEIITDLELEYDRPDEGTCGSCRRCLDACPTRALMGPDMIDARRCISYLTIEHRGPIPAALGKKTGNRIFGCDLCQEVCPYNLSLALPAKNADFNKPLAGSALNLKEILALKDEEAFKQKFAGSPLMRTKLAGLKRNARIALENEKAGV